MGTFPKDMRGILNPQHNWYHINSVSLSIEPIFLPSEKYGILSHAHKTSKSRMEAWHLVLLVYIGWRNRDALICPFESLCGVEQQEHSGQPPSLEEGSYPGYKDHTLEEKQSSPEGQADLFQPWQIRTSEQLAGLALIQWLAELCMD